MKTLLGAFLICASISAAAQQPMESSAMARQGQEVATAALGTLRSMVTEENFQSLGFESAKEVNSAVIDPPIAVFMVRLDELRAYQVGQNAEALLRPANRLIFPVSVSGKVRSSIVVEQAGEKLVASSFGGPKLVTAITRYRDENAKATGTPARDYFAVHAAALGVYFIGHRGSSGLILVPIVDDPRAEFSAGRALPLGDAIQRLAVLARAYNGLPM
jgi:hypothetical protein